MSASLPDTSLPPVAPPRAARPREGLIKTLFIVGFSAFILVGGGMGFFGKIIKFVLAWMGRPEDRFALIPVAMYFCVAAGFACVFIWAVLNGMLHDIEGPKYQMLQNEEDLNKLEDKEPQDPWA